MKTDTLKFKAVMLAIALASTGPTVIVPMDAADTTQADYQNQFIEAMFTQIRDGVTATIDLVESFIDKTNTESFSAFIKRCHDQMVYFQDNILTPLKQELDYAKATQPGSDYYKIMQKTNILAIDAYKKLEKFHAILENHRKGPDAKKATILVKALQPHLQELISTKTLDELDQRLSEIHELLDKSSAVASEIENLTALVKKLRTKAAAMQGKVNAELLPIISARLKKP